MLGHCKSSLFQSVVILIAMAAYAGLSGCSGAGGKGLKRLSELANFERNEFPEDLAAESQAGSETASCIPTDQDPFGRIPPGWPAEIVLHPRAIVALGGRLSDDGLFMLMLVSPDIATSLGIQNFYIESLTGWESVSEYENPDPNAEEGGFFVIVAERNNTLLRVVSGEVPSDFYTMLYENEHQYWLDNVGPVPLFIRLYYYPSSE